MKISRFAVVVQNALFRRRFVTAASSEEAAAQIVMDAELCPRRCIIKIENLGAL